MVDKIREIALKTLYKIDKEKAFSNIVLNEMIKNNQKELEVRDIGLISEITYGVVTWKLTIDSIIEKHSKIKLKKISPWIINILRMGIYQIIFLDKIPKSAAVNESVNLAKKYGNRGSIGYVNALLRKVSEKDYEEMKEIEDSKERLSKMYSIPEWIIEELLEEKTFDEVQEICRCSNLRPNISIRVNTLKTDKEELIKILNEQNIENQNGEIENFLILKKANSVEKIKGFKEGLFTIQDEAAGLIAKILNPKVGEKVLDCCSSPGGKTTYLAEIMKNTGKIIAWDLYPHRVELVKQNAKRLGISNIETEVNDASIYNEKYLNQFDKILLDVPCMGIGVLKRKPDIKWNRKKEDIYEISTIQKNILQTCSKYLKVGGELVYSTCSILKEENEEIIEEFLKNNKNFEIEKIEISKENFFNKYLKIDGTLQVYQNENSDGFYICKIIKKC